MTQDEINSVRLNLLRYRSLTNDVDRWKDKRLELETIILRTIGEFPPKMPDGYHEPNIHKHSKMNDDVDKLTILIDSTEVLIQIIDDFIESLEANDKKMFKQLYINSKRRSQSTIANNCNYGRTSLQKRVEYCIKKYWRF